MPTHRENVIQMMLCDFVKYQYPGAIFVSDSSGEHRQNMGQRLRAKRLRSTVGYPDWFLAEPKGIYHGCFLELKQEGYKLRKSTKPEWVNPHVEAQADCHDKLRERGYFVTFAIGLEDAIDWVRQYMALSFGEKLGKTRPEVIKVIPMPTRVNRKEEF